MVRNSLILCIAALGLLFAMPGVSAQENRTLPYWMSISAEEARMRVGAGQQYPIEWVYRRPGLPVKVLRSFQGWRLIEEPDGTQGWMYDSLLSNRRTALVIGEGLAPMRESGAETAALRWNLEPGVIGELGECASDWCELNVNGARGWVAQERLWGAGEP